ncbi:MULTISPECIES: sensor histidine kinase [Clostridium]|uniref:sensor histidine kinase n=1 Tax=Clostridium TaxID=1485 RepID=UPI0009BC8DC4|nr:MULTISPECIES: histidine kinase [Clostridium]
MNNNAIRMVMGINYGMFVIIMIMDCLYNYNKWIPIITLYLIFMTLYTINAFALHNVPIKVRRNRLAFFLLYSIEVSLIFIINRIDTTIISNSLYFFIIADIVIDETYIWSIICSFILCTISSIAILNKPYDKGTIVILIMGSFLILVIVYLIFFLINRLLNQNLLIQESLKDATIKKMEKDSMYDDLRVAYEKVETMTALKERNRIAREIHDTVGHTLTTVLVEIEACKRLMAKDNIEKSLEKLDLAQGQVRKGLNSIRESVRILEKGNEIMDFYSELKSIAAETEKHSGVIIKFQVDESIKFSEDQKKVIISTFVEGLTNGIKHGNSTAFLLKIYRENERAYFSLENNGKASDVIVPGFGLRAMKGRAEEIGADFSVLSKSGEGFGIYLSFEV